MAKGRRFIVEVLGDGKSLTKSLKKASDDAMTFGDKVAAATKRMAIPAAAAFAGLSASALSFARAAAEDERSSALLAEQLKRTTGATNAQVAANEQFVSSMSMAVGVADDELRPALAQLVRATGDVGKAQSLLRTALDVSAGSGKSLSTVVQGLSRASQGQFTALRRLGIPLDENIIKTKDFDAVLRVLAQTYGGQASVAAGTAEGQMRRFGVAVGEAQEAIGAALLPALEAILPKLIGLAQWVQRNSGLIVGIGTAVAGFAGAVLLANGALKVWTTSAKIAALVNTGLASSYLAVQIATGVGVITAVAAAASIANIALNMRNATKSAMDFSDEMTKTGESVTYGFVRPVRNATEATTALFGVMGAISPKVLELGNSVKGGLAGPMGAIAQVFPTAAKSAESSFGKIATSAGKTATEVKKVDDSFKQFSQNLKNIKDQVRSYVDSINNQITGTVSLVDAFNTAQAEQEAASRRVEDAFKARALAYERLGQIDQTEDAKGYAQALADVAAAQKEVNDAQAVTPRTYGDVFRQQVAAAKNFASNLSALVSTGALSRDALQQLLALGPVAGAQVTSDLLSGIGGMTAASLSADLASVSAAGTALGMAVPGVAALLGASAGRTGDNYYITVQTGVGDKAAIANEVVDLLKVYNRTNGAVPVRVSYSSQTQYTV